MPEFRQYYSTKFSIQLQDQLTFEEGKKLAVYPDPKKHGILTIGIGHNLTIRPRWSNGVPIAHTLTDLDCFKLLAEDLNDTLFQLIDHWSGFKFVSLGARRDAIIAMCFQLGISTLIGFVDMRNAIEFTNWEEAYRCALDSIWAEQCPGRAIRVATQLKSGVYYDVPNSK